MSSSFLALAWHNEMIYGLANIVLPMGHWRKIEIIIAPSHSFFALFYWPPAIDQSRNHIIPTKWPCVNGRSRKNQLKKTILHFYDEKNSGKSTCKMRRTPKMFVFMFVQILWDNGRTDHVVRLVCAILQMSSSDK